MSELIKVGGFRLEEQIYIVNPNDADWTDLRFVLWFGAYGWTRLLVWANHLEDAIDEAIDWIADHEPGLLVDEAVADEYRRAIAKGMSEDDAIEEAEIDTTCGGNSGHYLNSWEWGIVAEDPSRSDLLALQGRPAYSKHGAP